jgi:hypothetical protein
LEKEAEEMGKKAEKEKTKKKPIEDILWSSKQKDIT